MAGAFEIVMENRRVLVEKIIGMMKQGYFFNQEEWDRDALRPHNPLSKVRYKGGNRMRLMQAVMEHGYTDPRWATGRQYQQKGYYIKKGEKGILCEKWIFQEEKLVENDRHEMERVLVDLEIPKVSYFTVFNGLQVQDFPEYEKREEQDMDLVKLMDDLLSTSKCKIREVAQPRAFYSPMRDEIVLPIRESFKDMESFAKTAIHEMGHSTGHPDRLNRKMGGLFGSPDYAGEELRAELGTLFVEADLGINLRKEHEEDHADYLKSWIGVLHDNYNELFRACADAEKIASYLVGNYEKTFGIAKEEYLDIPIREIEKKKIQKKWADRHL